jgi:hypothetical protein
MKGFLLAIFLTCCLGSGSPDPSFAIETINDTLYDRILKGGSFVENPYIQRNDLRHLRLLHYDGNGKICVGNLICHKSIAQDLKEIFEELYRQKYPIQRIQLIDDFGADDEQSMRANNTYCFCFRTIAGSKKLSKHAQGLAIDINPLYNPCVKTPKNGQRIVQPSTARKYVDRSKTFPYKITKSDLCYRLFIQHGFRWGGNWKSLKDYQHFEK